MELLKEKTPLEFTKDGITFLVRSEATAEDRLEIIALSDIGQNQLKLKKSELMMEVIRRFVVGWRGVTEDGKEAPYSFEAVKRLPTGTDVILLELAAFICDKTGILKLQNDLKNESREPLSGHAK